MHGWLRDMEHQTLPAALALLRSWLLKERGTEDHHAKENRNHHFYVSTGLFYLIKSVLSALMSLGGILEVPVLPHNLVVRVLIVT